MESLPPELYQEIFLYLAGRDVTPFLPDGRDYPDDEEMAGHMAIRIAPYQLAAVCNLWRSICMKTPMLWSYIDISGPVSECQVEYARVHLARSGVAPLHIVLEGGYAHEQTFLEILELVGEHAHHWASAWIGLPELKTTEQLEVFRKPMPLLEEIVLISGVTVTKGELIDRDWQSYNSHRDLPPYLGDSPRLRYLESHVMCIVPKQPLVHLEYLSYSLRDVEDEPLWLMLQMTPALRELTMNFCGHPLRQVLCDSLSAEIMLPALTRLGVYGLPGNSDWMGKIKMPLVHTLSCSIESCDQLIDLFDALSQQITHLILTSIEEESIGYLGHRDAEAICHLTAVETFELAGLCEDIFEGEDESFFRYLLDAAKAQCTGSPARCRRLIIRNSQMGMQWSENVMRYVGSRMAAASEEGGPPFGVHLENFTFNARAMEGVENPNWFYECKKFFVGAVIAHDDINYEIMESGHERSFHYD